MGKFTNGVLLGLGITLLFTPKNGEEMRNFLTNEVRRFRGTPSPEEEHLKQSVLHMADRVKEVQHMADHATQMETEAHAAAQETSTNAQSMRNDLRDVAQRAGVNVPQEGGTSGNPQPNQRQKA